MDRRGCFATLRDDHATPHHLPGEGRRIVYLCQFVFPLLGKNKIAPTLRRLIKPAKAHPMGNRVFRVAENFLEPRRTVLFDIRDYLPDTGFEIVVPDCAALVEPCVEASDRRSGRLAIRPAGQPKHRREFASRRDKTEASAHRPHLARCPVWLARNKAVAEFPKRCCCASRVIRKATSDEIEISSDRRAVTLECRSFELISELAW